MKIEIGFFGVLLLIFIILWGIIAFRIIITAYFLLGFFLVPFVIFIGAYITGAIRGIINGVYRHFK